MISYSSFTDQELLHQLKADDESAFTEVYNRYWKLLYTTALRIVRDEYSAQDVVQDVFISFWNRRNEIEIQSLKAYLQQAVRFGVLKTIRAQKTDNAFYERLAAVTIDILADDPLVFKEQQDLIKKLLNGLPDDCVEAFHLSREENLTYKQIAVKLNISEKTVEKRISKSLKYLRGSLNYEMCIAILFLWQHS